MTKSTTDEVNKDAKGNYASVNGLKMYYSICEFFRVPVPAALDS